MELNPNEILVGCTNGLKLVDCHSKAGGPGSVVDIATGYGLDGPGIESRFRARFFTPVQTGPGATQLPVQWVPGLSRG